MAVACSDNNGMDWKEISNGTSTGPQEVDLSPLVLRRYTGARRSSRWTPPSPARWKRRACVIDARVDHEEKVYPMVPAGGSSAEMIDVEWAEDDNAWVEEGV